jgi:hemerythrin-like domain-containing protein
MTRKRDAVVTMTEALREDHRNIARLLRALERQIDTIARSSSGDYDIIVGIADYFLQYPDRCHHPKEDLIVAKLKEAHPDVAGRICELIDEHGELHERALRFRRAVGSLLDGADVPRSAIVDLARGFIAAQYRHMREEEDSLFPTAERVLTASEWADIEDRFNRRADRVNGPWVEETFRSVRARLVPAEDGQGAR